MKRELRALGEGAEQNQNQSRAIKVVRADQAARCEDPVEVVAARDVPEQQHAAKEAEPAGRGDDQRHTCAVAGARILVPIADQQK